MVNHKKLSEQLARLYKTTDYLSYNGHDYYYITQDIASMMKLAIENDINVHQSKRFGYVEAVYADDNKLIEEVEYYNNDPVEATCVAIASALIKLKETNPTN